MGFVKEISCDEWCRIELARHLSDTPWVVDRDAAIETLINELDDKAYGLNQAQVRDAVECLRGMMENNHEMHGVIPVLPDGFVDQDYEGMA